MLATREALHVLHRAVALVAIVGMMGCGPIVDRFSGRTESCEILRIGTPATAQIVRLIDTGITINNDPVVEFVLRVNPPDGQPYEARAKALVSRLDIPSVQPGRIVPVKFDSQMPSRVAIDLWDCPKE
jgi:hypothetical protein